MTNLTRIRSPLFSAAASSPSWKPAKQAAGKPPVAASKPAAATAKPASSPQPAPKTISQAKPLSPRLKAIRDEMVAEMEQEAKAKRQAEVDALWDRAIARAFNMPMPENAPIGPQTAVGRMWDAAYARLAEPTTAA